MSPALAFWRRVRRHHLDFLFDYLVLSLALAGPLLMARPQGLLLVGLLFASGLGARIGGDPTTAGTWEWELTLPLSRRRWYRTRVVVGLLALLALAALFVVFHVTGLERWSASLLADPMADDVGAQPRAGTWASAVAALLFAYLVAFDAGVRAKRAENVERGRFSSLVLSVVLAGTVYAVAGALAPRLLEGLEPVEARAALFVPAMLVFSVAAYYHGGASVRAREATPEATDGGTGGAFFLTAALLALLLVGVLSISLFLARGGAQR